MFTKLKWLIQEWFTQKKQIKQLIANQHVLTAQFKYLQQRIDRMEVPR